VILGHEPQGRDGVRIVHVGEQKHQAAAFTNRRQVPDGFAEPGLFVQPVTTQVVQPEEHLCAREAGSHFEFTVAAAENPDRADSHQGRERQTAGELHRPAVLA
jgi:hypothetical protein